MMKFLTTMIPLFLLAATAMAAECMQPPYHCKGMSLLRITTILVTLFAATTSATECTVHVICTRSIGKSRLMANAPHFEDLGDSFSRVKCAQVDCSRTCRRSLEACRVLCGGNEELPRCAVGVSPPPPGHHGIPHTIPANYTTAN